MSIQDLLESLNSRGYGPLLIAPALIAALPTGAIPTVPTICAIMIISIAVQMLMGRSYPWLPVWIRKYSFSRKKFIYATGKIKLYTKSIDKIIFPRLKFMAHKTFLPFIAVSCILMAIVMSVVELIPFLAVIPAICVMLIGMGISGKDGALIIASLTIFFGSLAMIPLGISIVSD